ncbi:MAG: DnaJ domain-containing protein [Acidimicrobiia bacterium]
MARDFYGQLDVPTTASQSQVLAAYLDRVRRSKPGIAVKSDHHKVRELNVAYTVLSDPGDREKYDRLRAGESCPWCGQRVSAHDVEHHVTGHTAEGARDGCFVCGRLPAHEFTYRAIDGIVVWWKTHEVDAHLCRTCSTGVFRAMQARTLARGPWGVPSLIATPFLLIRNWLTHRKTSSMKEPQPNDPAYDRGPGLGRALSARAAVWVSVLALSAILVIVAQAVLPAGQTPTGLEGDSPASTAAVSDGPWVSGDCARMDMAARPQPTPCDGNQFATVVAIVPSASDCPDSSDWSVPSGDQVACFQET